MTCSHCGTDHKDEPKCWPESWSEDRRIAFVRMMAAVGVVPGYAPAMAAEVEKLSLHSEYVVSEVELFSYLHQSAAISKRITVVNGQRENWLAWSRRITRPLTIKIVDDKVSICTKLLILAIIGLPMLALTSPIRLFFWLRKWLINRNFHPYFTGWLKKNGIKK